MSQEIDTIIDNYIKNQAEIAWINTEADAAKAGIKTQLKELDNEMYKRQKELDDEKSRRGMVLNNCLVSVQNTRKYNLEPLYERINQVKRIIAMLRIAETIQPVRDIEDGDISALETHFYEDKEEYGGKSISDDSMWIAVYLVNGMIDHSLTEYGYESLDELIKTHKKEKITGLTENRKGAELEDARDIAEMVLEALQTEDNTMLYIEGELNLPPGSIEKAHKTLHKARKQSQNKRTKINRDEIIYSLCVEDIFIRAGELKIPKKKLTPEIVKEIKNRIDENASNYLNEIANENIEEIISEVIRDTGGADQ